MITRSRNFLLDVRKEMEKVTWPSSDELKASTTVVLMFLVLLAVVIGSMDFIFQTAILWLFNITA